MRRLRWAAPTVLVLLTFAAPAAATPVCTDGYKGGPPSSLCGGRIFPEAVDSKAYVQYSPDPVSGFIEYQHGIEYLAQKYPRWISVTTLRNVYGSKAVSAGNDGVRSEEAGDSGDGRDIQVIKITDHSVADKGKETLLYSLSVHGNERGGLEGGLRTAEDLARAAVSGGKLSDGVANYESSAGRAPSFNQYEARDLLKKEAVYLVSFNPDGWAVGDFWNQPFPMTYARGNGQGTDLNRQMPSVGRINPSRNPLQETEMKFGTRFMHAVAAAGRTGKMAYGADIHGEINSQAYMDVMYPAGEFDSVDHRRLMAIAERTKSVIDATLYDGIIDEVENASGGNEAEYPRAIPLKPAHWATVWDTLGYTDTGFIGDYMATDLGVTGMDYEIFFNHTVPEKFWNIYLQENHITATRGIIKTAMAYALKQSQEFSPANVKVRTVGRAGYVVNPDTVTDKDANGVGTRPGPDKNGIGEDGKPVAQRSYNVTNQRWFSDTNKLMPKPFRRLAAADVALKPPTLDTVDSLVLADIPAPADTRKRRYDKSSYYRNLRSWVQRGGNLVLTDRSLHALDDLGIVKKDAIEDINVYQPHANFKTLTHPLTKGLRPNARQLTEAAILGYGIGNTASPMTVVNSARWRAAGGQVIATTGTQTSGEDPALDRQLDDGSLTSVGELKVGKGKVRIVGGALPMPTESQDHRYGLRNYGLTYSGLFLMENAIAYDAAGLGNDSATSCLARRSPVGRRNIGRVRLGSSRRSLLLSPRLARLRPVTTQRKRYRYCVRRSGGRVTAVFGRRGKVELVSSNASGHGNRRVRPGTSARRLRRAYPNRRRIGRGLYRLGKRDRRVVGVRKGKVRFVAVASRRVLLKRNRKALRTYVSRAGF